VFSALFNDPDLLRELYCALGNVSLPPDVPVSINTLENVLYMDLYNDISFEIGGKLIVLVEHQSTINPNMALRLLHYISSVYEAIIESKTLYSNKPVSIPWPEFFVLYNGIEPYPDNKVLRLSDLFKNPQELGLPEKSLPLLELEVKVLNINEGRNEEIVRRCKKLAEYSAFVAKYREYYKGMKNKEEALKAAITYCSKYGILKEFLEVHGREVLSMILTEWNIDDAIAFAREESREEGREEEKLEIARNLLIEGSTPAFIQKITGLDLKTIQGL
jgi:predicted transposase/invertase (TIGR01784 family)